MNSGTPPAGGSRRPRAHRPTIATPGVLGSPVWHRCGCARGARPRSAGTRQRSREVSRLATRTVVPVVRLRRLGLSNARVTQLRHARRVATFSEAVDNLDHDLFIPSSAAHRAARIGGNGNTQNSRLIGAVERGGLVVRCLVGAGSDRCGDLSGDRRHTGRGAVQSTGVTMRKMAFLVATLASLSSSLHAVAQTVGQLCSRATMTAAATGTITAETFRYGGVDRHFCTYTPSSINDGTPHPLVIALHGGSGNASQMMEDNHGHHRRGRGDGLHRGLPQRAAARRLRRRAVPRQQLGRAGQRLLHRRADRPAEGDWPGARRPRPPGRLLRRRLADLRHRRHPRLPARDPLGRDGRRRLRALSRRPPRRRLQR